MDSSTKIRTIRYGLNQLHISGRQSLGGALIAMRKLKEWDGLGHGFDYHTVKTALETITVNGEKDVDTLLACIQILDELTEEENHESNNQQGENV